MLFGTDDLNPDKVCKDQTSVVDQDPQSISRLDPDPYYLTKIQRKFQKRS